MESEEDEDDDDDEEEEEDDEEEEEEEEEDEGEVLTSLQLNRLLRQTDDGRGDSNPRPSAPGEHWLKLGHHYDTVNGYPIREPLAYLRRAQLNWERRVQRSLRTISLEIQLPLAQYRSRQDRDELVDKWRELSQYETDVSQFRPVFAPKDLLEVFLKIRNPNHLPMKNDLEYEFGNLPVHTKDLNELRDFYPEISRGDQLLGVDKNLPTGNAYFPTLESLRTHHGERVILQNTSAAAKEFIKHGCPVTLRGRIWTLALNCVATPRDRAHYRHLKELLLTYDLLVDKLVIKDIQQTASNDDQFFAFEDVLFEVLLLFTRDTEVLRLFSRCSASPIHAVLKDAHPLVRNTVIYPPCGVVPFHGFCMYAAPFCYVYDDPTQLYVVFRHCYTRYFYKLHEANSDPEGLLALCATYERLLQRHEPEIWFHFQDIGVVPVGAVFKWLVRAFSGHLPPAELLLLWDLVIAGDSLAVLPLLACAIVGFRKINLLRVHTRPAVEAVLADLSSIAVMPLIQFALIRE